jgi:glutamate racemase
MKQTPRLAVLDWGIGGISVYQLIKAQLGAIPILYFSDTGAVPYGRLSRPELVARLRQVIAFLQTQGATHLVIGCNAASTAIPWLHTADLPVEGVIESAVRLTVSLQPARLGLLGGRRTVLSGIAQPLSALIETGDVSSATLRAQCRKILGPLRNCSHLLLACTHYPAITAVLREFVAPETVLIDPAGALIEQLRHWQLPTEGDDVFLTTGSPEQMKHAAQQAFGCQIKTAQRVVV